VRLRVCVHVRSRATSCVGRLRGLCHCRLLGAVVLLQEVPVQEFERAKGGGIPTGGVLEVVVWQPDLLSGAGKGAQEATNLELVVYDVSWQVMVLLETLKQPLSCDSWSSLSTQSQSC
jgi:hypothetical protein